MKKILFFLLFPLLVNSQTIMMSQQCHVINVTVDSLSNNYNTSNAVLTTVGSYNDLVSIDIDTSGFYFTVNFIEQTITYMILSTFTDTINGGTTYSIQDPITSDYGMVYMNDGTYIVVIQVPWSFNKLNGILCFDEDGCY